MEFCERLLRFLVYILTSLWNNIACRDVSTVFLIFVEKNSQEAIECLTSISDSSTTQRIFTSSMERSGITNGSGEYRKLGFHSDGSTDNEENNTTLLGEVAKR